MHQISAALLAYVLLTQVLAETSFSRLPLYIYAGVSGLLNVFFMCRYCYNNFARWRRPELIYSEVAASEIHGKTWLHLQLKAPRRVHMRPGQYISLWIPGVQLFSSHPFAATTTYDEHGTSFHVYIDPANGITKKLIKPLLHRKMAAGELERQTIETRREQPQGPVDQTRQKIAQDSFPPRFALFSGPHGRSVDHREFEVVVLVASGFGYWSLHGYLEDMLRTGRGGTRTREIVLLYKGKPRKSLSRCRSARSSL